MPERCWTTSWVVDLNTGKFFEQQVGAGRRALTDGRSPGAGAAGGRGFDGARTTC